MDLAKSKRVNQAHSNQSMPMESQRRLPKNFSWLGIPKIQLIDR
jgi:hypothetical protein